MPNSKSEYLENLSDEAKNWLRNQEYKVGYQAIRAQRLRKTVLAYYGDKCACCGESKPEFLQIDHKNNDGYKYKGTKLRCGTGLHKYIIDQGFPPEYQILCANCNFGKHLCGGICPHKLP